MLEQERERGYDRREEAGGTKGRERKSREWRLGARNEGVGEEDMEGGEEAKQREEGRLVKGVETLEQGRRAWAGAWRDMGVQGKDKS